MENTDKKVLNRSILILLILVLLFVLVILVAGKNRGSETVLETKEPGKQMIINLNGHNLVASVAESSASREKGLAGTHYLNDQSGMFFIFDEPGQHGFWMKGMQVPIDIFGMDEFYRIVYIEDNVTPDTYPKVYKPTVPVKYVLEANAGFAKRNNIEIGHTIVATPLEN